MSKHPKSSRTTAALDKKLAAYTLAGAAALIVPGVAKADIVEVNVDQTFTQGTLNNSFDFAGSPFAGDITITAASTPGFDGDANNEISASTIAGAGIVTVSGTSTPAQVADLAFGTAINSGSNFGTGGKMYGYDTVNSSFSGGQWSSSDAPGEYLGFYFGGTTDPQYGWAQIETMADATGSSFEVLDYAYETVPNTPIAAGQVPEPSALPLLVLGAAGLIALRRRRQANA